ncbi:MAG TPA: endonuclease/exonuclease/phosphatase family protein [Gammaproteobacteria bacterium]|nr:endonuclease/exonuclease/phosphatase family protein [Gammaproteobacteria bacterium]
MRWLDGLLTLFAALLVAVNLLPLGARFWWVIDLTTHFRVQYVAVTLVLLALLALRRRWPACVVLAAAGAVSVVPVVPYLPLAPRAAVVDVEPRLKVLSVNVSYRQFSVRRLLEMVRDIDPHVVVLQELTPYANEVLAPLDEPLPHYFKMPAEGRFGIAVWSRLPLESAVPFALGRQPAIEARVRFRDGAVTLLGVHLNAPTSARRAAARDNELRLLAERSAAIEGPLVVAGDFNLTPYSPLFGDWLAASGLTDTRRGRTPSVSWRPADLPILGIPIDHVAVSSEFAILAHRRLPNFGSDHYGVLAELALTGAETP